MTSVHTTRQKEPAQQAWAGGLTVFAAIMLGITGLAGIVRGIMAIAKDDVFVITPNYVFKFDLTSWGWIHLTLGIAAILVSFGLSRTSTWSRIVGVGIAALVIIANLLSLPYYPAWSILVIAISGFVIWALCVVKRD
ncbi:hypothetical protein [Streptomyces californicus]|uniref:DUF7144 family membrane protein n=1 Tax=Streptomyces californicus TaxID=67351 RepID=UPI00296F7F4E|nr:hypothetical protein [Streptomyces californicus]MDW4917971.1 hypothetical protein [Streptomyces californicus]